MKKLIIFDLDLSMNSPFRRNDNGGNWGNFNPNGGNGGWGSFKPRNSIFENVVNRYDRSQFNPFFYFFIKK